MRAVSLAIALALFWLALSGLYKPFLLSVGACCVVVSVFVAHRLGALDREGHPTQVFVGAITYFPWLVWEIVKSCWAVTKIIVDPRLPISPTMTTVQASQKSAVGIVSYANSITLTPGTITTRVDGDVLTVHALVAGGADDLEGGGMDARVTRFERGL